MFFLLDERRILALRSDLQRKDDAINDLKKQYHPLSSSFSLTLSHSLSLSLVILSYRSTLDTK